MTLSLIPGVVGGRHSSASVEHYSPPAIVEAARATLGAIDLDPASSELANRVVRASVYFDDAADGLSGDWTGRRVFCNPPGGRAGRESSQALWWRKAAREWAEHRIDACVFVIFSLELLQVAQVCAPSDLPLPTDLPLCVPSARIAYHVPTDQVDLFSREAALVGGPSPRHASAIAFFPPRSRDGIERFKRHFSPFGAIVNACFTR